VPEHDLPALYSGAECFVYPSFYEGHSQSPLEAMACGTPAVVSQSSCFPEIVGDAALLVDPYDVEAMAEAIARVLNDAALRVELVRKGRQRAAQFSWDKTARETLAVYLAAGTE